MGDDQSNGNAPKRKKPQFSEEEREKRRQRMIELRKQGKVGPQFGKLGGRPKKPRASEKLAEEAEKHAEQMLDVLKAGISPSSNMSTRLRALEQWLKIEGEERKAEMEEEEHLAKMSRDELMHEFAKKIEGNPMLKDMFVKAMNGESPGAVPLRVPNEEDLDIMEADVVDEQGD